MIHSICNTSTTLPISEHLPSLSAGLGAGNMTCSKKIRRGVDILDFPCLLMLTMAVNAYWAYCLGIHTELVCPEFPLYPQEAGNHGVTIETAPPTPPDYRPVSGSRALSRLGPGEYCFWGLGGHVRPGPGAAGRPRMGERWSPSSACRMSLKRCWASGLEAPS